MRHYADGEVRRLDSGWSVAATAAGAWSSPPDFVEAEFVPAIVPGTLAAALAAAGRFDAEHPQPLQDLDAWYRCRLVGAPGPAILRLDGLATLAEVFLNGKAIGRNESMYVASELAVELSGEDDLVIRFAALTDALAARGPRALWRPRLFDNQGLRLVRTTLLGHMPGWCPSIQAVGPYREVSLIRPGSLTLDDVRIAADLAESGAGLLTFSCAKVPNGLLVRCAGVAAPLVAEGSRSRATLRIPEIEPWWPATHGNPRLYDIELVNGHSALVLGRTGFRHLEVERGEGEDFAIRINGEPIFCRGAVWTSADLLGLSGSRGAYEPILTRIVAAGMNMVRLPGIATYESPSFFELCDELGVLVFADFMFANFDYPGADPAFADLVEAEVRQFLAARQGSPALAVLCAGSEIAQQAAMLGLPSQRWYSALATQTLPALVADYRPDLAYVPGSPSGGPLPFSVDAGVGHYYGVGAYQRPLEDARRARVRFASECLAFANLPDDPALLAQLRRAGAEDPIWKLGVPKDPGTDWDFADTRDHYLSRLYGVEAAELRNSDPSGYLDYSRAAVTEVVTETFAEWRSLDSTCGGGLVFNLADLAPGAGWGVLDSTHRPKSIFRGLARAFQPIAVALTDEGTNGLRLHLINETAQAVEASIEVFGLHDGSVILGRAEREVSLAPRSTLAIPATDLYEGFFDYTYAYRFGPPAHEVTVARLRVGAQLIGEAFAFPLGRSAALQPARLDAELVTGENGWALQLATDRFAQSVHLEVGGFEAGDDWFHLVPGEARLVALRPLPGTGAQARPCGEVRSLGGATTRY